MLWKISDVVKSIIVAFVTKIYHVSRFCLRFISSLLFFEKRIGFCKTRHIGVCEENRSCLQKINSLTSLKSLFCSLQCQLCSVIYCVIYTIHMISHTFDACRESSWFEIKRDGSQLYKHHDHKISEILPHREQYHSLALSHFHITNTYNKHLYGFPVGNFSQWRFTDHHKMYS